MSRLFYVAKAMLLGLLTAQTIATLHVYLSNVELYRTVRIKTSDHWYKQWYAYRTLRRLGWKQSRIE